MTAIVTESGRAQYELCRILKTVRTIEQSANNKGHRRVTSTCTCRTAGCPEPGALCHGKRNFNKATTQQTTAINMADMFDKLVIRDLFLSECDTRSSLMFPINCTCSLLAEGTVLAN